MQRSYFLPVFLSIVISSCLFETHGGEGTLSISTHPDDIEIWLDGMFIGQSPVHKKLLTSGSYTLLFIDPSTHTSQSEQIVIKENEHLQMERTISPKFGSLTINSDPPGARVFISAEIGKTPVSNEFMVPGEYRLQIEHAGKYLPYTQEITITQGKPTTISPQLSKPQLLDNKKKLQLGIGIGAIAGFIWAIIEQKSSSDNMTKAEMLKDSNLQEYKKHKSKADNCALRRTIGLIIGTSGVAVLEATVIIW